MKTERTKRPKSLLLESVTKLPSVGPRAAQRLVRLGIQTVRHLLWHLPHRYEDYREVVPIKKLVPGEKQNIHGQVIKVASHMVRPRRMTITTLTIEDESGAVRAVWFNQPYIADNLAEGTQVSLAGKVVLDKRGLYLRAPTLERIHAEQTANLRHTGRLVPVYPETDGITSKFLRYLLQPLLERISIPDPLPQVIRTQYRLPSLQDAVRSVHFPPTVAVAQHARTRLAFDDVLLFQLKSLSEREHAREKQSPALAMDVPAMRALVAALPFTLTRDQRVAATEILKDMERPFPMNRLLEGDVGSGKTVVAFLAAMHTAHHGWQTVLLAPTEVLAQQHYRTLRAMQSAMPGVRVALLTSSAAQIDGEIVTKAQAKKDIQAGAVAIVIGTHAVLQSDVHFSQLALVIVDEQHRFGIQQRASLIQPGRQNKDSVPHFLSMTATPIPRTLALTVFGDLDISLIKEKPAGRRDVQTKVLLQRDRTKLYEAMRREVEKGRQIFVICPRVEISSSDGSEPKKTSQAKLLWADVKAVTDEFERLSQKIFPDLRIVMLHGKMKDREKEQIMREFKDGWYDIMVATSVVEVGVDVPNATMIVIEGADRFGLAQLHQFRGRVGRGEHQSYCFLLATNDNASQARLNAMTNIHDGFRLAETDLRLRGPGEFFGLRQSGLSELTVTALSNTALVANARQAAKTLMEQDATLKKYPLLREMIQQFSQLTHRE